LDVYQFSEPRVVLTHTSAIGIAGWLADGQQLLITRDIPGANRNSIDVLNIRTSELSTYAEREGNSGKPVWLPAFGAVAYVTLVEEERHEQRISYRPELWISYGNPQQVERLAPDVMGLSLAVEPDGNHLWYFSRSEPDRPQVFDGESRVIQTAPWNVAAWKYPKPDLGWAMRDRSPQFTMAWHPDGTRVVLYSQFWTFLLDVKTNRVCELTLGEYKPEAMDIPPWPLEAQWSPDGRYLAFITTDSLDMPFRRTELTILDMATGERRTLSPGSDIEPGRHFVTDIAWAPNGQMLAVLATVEYRDGTTWEGLYLVEATTGQNKHLLPHIVFPAGDFGWNLAWSPNGDSLAVTCLYGPLCLIEVTWP